MPPFKEEMPHKLYKYLPREFTNHLLDGTLLFRNLVYFQKLEADPRTDVIEGLHIDRPDHPIRIDKLSSGQTTWGNFAFHNSLERPDKVFCFCLSTNHDMALNKFGDSVVRINQPIELLSRLTRVLRKRARLTKLDRPLLLNDAVRYYQENKAAPPLVNIKNPTHLPFLKRHQFTEEDEYRFVFAKKHGFTLTEALVNENYSREDSLANFDAEDMKLQIGDIRDIAEII